MTYLFYGAGILAFSVLMTWISSKVQSIWRPEDGYHYSGD